MRLLPLSLLAGMSLAAAVHAAEPAEPITPKVVVVAMFENGEPTGDEPGELQFWVERLALDTVIDFPQGITDLRMNDAGVLAVLTGGGVTHAATTMAALGNDPRFDFSDSYWLIAGIAGADPLDASLGTAAWARWVVDGDLAKEIDAREIPDDWPYGMIPLGAKKPNDLSTGWTVDNIVIPLNQGLAHWAYGLTRDHPIDDSEGIAEFREFFDGYPNAQTPPRVMLGDSLSSSTYWHGFHLNQWANDWVKLHTDGEGNFVMTNMEDSGTLTALRRLAGAGKVDFDRIMVLRTASNYATPPPDEDVAWSTSAPYPEQGRPALEAAFQVGNRVVQELIGDWPRYRRFTPSAAYPKEKIKAVVVAMFEIGEYTGDRPAEFQHWVERYPLPVELDFPQGYKPLRYNPEKGVLGIVTGIGTFRSAASIMALGMDPRFDLSEAYWLVAGISGGDPEDISLASAAWAEWLIDGDLAHEIDIREAPEGWTTGYTPLRHAEPYAQPLPEDDEGVRYRLDPGLVEWAYQLTKDTELDDNEGAAELRARYVNFPNAQKPPFVTKGDQLAAMTFWHGKLMNDWANDWVDYWTEGHGEFMTSAMEETGSMQSLTFLENAGKVDTSRVLVLRTVSNFSMQHEGVTAQENLAGEKKGGYSAFLPSVENAFRVGRIVIDELVEGWEDYQSTPPSESTE